MLGAARCAATPRSLHCLGSRTLTRARVCCVTCTPCPNPPACACHAPRGARAVYALVSFLRSHVSATQFRNLAVTFAVAVVVGFAGLLLFLQVCVPV